MIYILLAIIFLISSFLEVMCVGKGPRRDITLLFYFLVAILLIVAGTRECGFDYFNYMNHYNILHSPFWRNQSNGLSVESSFGWICYVLPNYKMLVLLFALVSIGILFYFIYKNSSYPIFSIFLLLGLCFYSTYMGQIRQGLAISLVLMSFMSDNKMMKLGLNIFACVFHVTAVLGLLQFFTPKDIKDKKIYIYVLLIALAVNLTCYGVLLVIIPMLPAFVADKLSFYLATEEGMTLGLNAAMMLRLMIFTTFYIFRSSLNEGRYSKYLNLYFVSLVIYLGFGFLPQLAGRGALYFNILEIILAAKILSSMSKGKVKYCVYLFFILVTLYRQVSLFTSEIGFDMYIPYKSWII